MELMSQGYLLLLLLLVPYIIWYVRYRKKSEPTMRMSDTQAYKNAPKSWRIRLIHLPMVLRCLAFTALIIALARPQTYDPWDTKQVEGIDIMLAMDISTSMLAEDVNPNRIEVAKDVALDFISDRPNDNIGLTIFAGEAFTQCPPTTDHTSLINILRSVRTDLTTNGLIEDGTAVGMGLSNAVSRLKDSKTKSKVVILLTDGSNNRGDISPMTAAEIAKNFGIRVYTIGFGTNGITRYPIQINGTTQYINARGDIDYKTLQDIAVSTNGNFYRATSKAELQKIYEDIDKLEKTKLMSRSYAQRYEAYAPFVVAALILLLIEIILRISVLRRIP